MLFPRTTVAGISLPRMLIGSNWMLGFSHTGPAADAMINARHSDPKNVSAVADAYMGYGIDAVMACEFPASGAFEQGLRMTEEKFGHKIIRIATPIINVDDTAQGRAEAEKKIKEAAKEGSTFCFLHHMACEQLINKNKQTMNRLPDYLDMIRQNGMIPGLSAHMPEVILYADQNEYDVETYIQIYNCMGFMMQIEIEGVNSVIWNAKKPVMTIKPMAAGRCTPFVGITFSFSTIRECDMVTVGAFSPDEVYEDVEIGMAAIEHRHPLLGKRSSPGLTPILAVRE